MSCVDSGQAMLSGGSLHSRPGSCLGAKRHCNMMAGEPHCVLSTATSKTEPIITPCRTARGFVDFTTEISVFEPRPVAYLLPPIWHNPSAFPRREGELATIIRHECVPRPVLAPPQRRGRSQRSALIRTGGSGNSLCTPSSSPPSRPRRVLTSHAGKYLAR